MTYVQPRLKDSTSRTDAASFRLDAAVCSIAATQREGNNNKSKLHTVRHSLELHLSSGYYLLRMSKLLLQMLFRSTKLFPEVPRFSDSMLIVIGRTDANVIEGGHVINCRDNPVQSRNALIS